MNLTEKKLDISVRLSSVNSADQQNTGKQCSQRRSLLVCAFSDRREYFCNRHPGICKVGQFGGNFVGFRFIAPQEEQGRSASHQSGTSVHMPTKHDDDAPLRAAANINKSARFWQ